MNYAQYLQGGGETQSQEQLKLMQIVNAFKQDPEGTLSQIPAESQAKFLQQMKQLAEELQDQELDQIVQQIAQSIGLLKCGGKVRAKVKKACGGKKLEEGDKIKKAKKGCPCSLKKVGGKLIEVDCNGIPVAKNGTVLLAKEGTSTSNMKLPSRSYWQGFKARNEALWDKIKNNTFVNMLFPVQEVSEGNTESILPLVVPGGNAAVLTVNAVGKKAVGRAASAVKRGAAVGQVSLEPYWAQVISGRANRAPSLKDAKIYADEMNRLMPDNPMSVEEALADLRHNWNIQLQPAAEREADAYLHSVGKHINGASYKKQGGSLNYAQYLNLK